MLTSQRVTMLTKLGTLTVPAQCCNPRIGCCHTHNYHKSIHLMLPIHSMLQWIPNPSATTSLHQYLLAPPELVGRTTMVLHPTTCPYWNTLTPDTQQNMNPHCKWHHHLLQWQGYMYMGCMGKYQVVEWQGICPSRTHHQQVLRTSSGVWSLHSAKLSSAILPILPRNFTEMAYCTCLLQQPRHYWLCIMGVPMLLPMQCYHWQLPHLCWTWHTIDLLWPLTILLHYIKGHLDTKSNCPLTLPETLLILDCDAQASKMGPHPSSATSQNNPTN